MEKQIERYILRYLNRSRKKRGELPLKSNLGLKIIARNHSREMAKRGNIWHGNGAHIAGRYFSINGFFELLKFIFIHKGCSGENVAMTSSRSSSRTLGQSFHKMWIKSPGHRKNMLNSDFSAVGIGVKRGRRGYFATELFYG